MDLELICRFCLEKFNASTKQEEKDEIIEELNQIFNLEIYEEDAWPKKICFSCREKSVNCLDFIKKIRDGEKKLLELFGEKFQDLKKEIIYPDELPLEVKQEVLEDEDVKFEEENASEDVLSDSPYEEESSSDESEASEDRKVLKPQIKNEGRKKCGRKRKPPKKDTKKMTIIKENDAIVKKYLGFKCEICSHDARSYFALKYHFRMTHREKGYLTCCSMKFTDLGRLAVHIQKHCDPECFKCTKCSKVLGNQESLKVHLQGCQVDPKNYTYTCEICSEAYPTNRGLYSHRRKMHSSEEDKIHKCSDCSKSYLTPSELKFHWLYAHDTNKHSVCDICGKSFRTKYEADIHMKNTHLKKDTPKVKCNRCGGYYANEMTLKLHQKRCQTEPVECNHCGKVSANEVALQKHIAYAHSEKGRKTYQCDMCPKFFSTKRLLIDHTAKHNNIPRHKCKYCEMHFYTLSAKYAHQRVHHPAENAAAKIRKP